MSLAIPPEHKFINALAEIHIALRIIIEAKPGAALNAVSEDHPELVRAVADAVNAIDQEIPSDARLYARIIMRRLIEMNWMPGLKP